MLQTLSRGWKNTNIRNKMLFTLFVIVIFRLGNALPVPFVDKNIIKEIFESAEGSILGMLNLLSGGGLRTLSLFALGVGPYITASIVVQLLTFAIPSLEELSKEGEEGRKKIQRITKYLGVVLALFQAIAIVKGLFGRAIISQGLLENVTIILSMVAGSQFLVWLGELITDKGIGNGVSVIIFVGIVSRLPHAIISFTHGLFTGNISIISIILLLIIFLAIIIVVVLLSEGERKVPVHYAKRVVGRKLYGGQATHIPIKVNMGGVLPIIFAGSLIAIPQTLSLFIGGGFQEFVNKFFLPTTWTGTIIHSVLYAILIILFAYFYNTVQFNSQEYSRNLQQYGGFIQGIRPGRPTAEYLGNIVNKITIIGAVVLAVLAILPTVLSKVFNLHLTFGGTSVIIVVGVILEAVRQVEALLQMTQYSGKGFTQ